MSRPPPRTALSDSTGFSARSVFAVALGFLALSATLGALLRVIMVHPIPGLNYGNLLHTHSHIAFLGWVFNACFAVALNWFLPVETKRAWRRLFIILQVAVLGMLCSYPWQGYGAVSISFSTLHMIAAAVFAWWLWRDQIASAAARPHLLLALVCLLVSGLGPLALGPLAAMDLRDSPAYTLSIYFYLHAQYNGWFLFFLQAAALQLADQSGAVNTILARRSAWWLGSGVVLTFAQSTLWLSPPLWVNGLAAVGGLAQLIGCGYFIRAITPALQAIPGSLRVLGGIALASWLLKHLLQLAAAWPELTALASHRFIAIAFLHLVFLGIVTPALLALASHAGWLRPGRSLVIWLGLFFGGAVIGQLLLVAWPLGFSAILPNPFSTLAVAAVITALGAIGLSIRASWRGTTR